MLWFGNVPKASPQAVPKLLPSGLNPNVWQAKISIGCPPRTFSNVRASCARERDCYPLETSDLSHIPRSILIQAILMPKIAARLLLRVLIQRLVIRILAAMYRPSCQNQKLSGLYKIKSSPACTSFAYLEFLLLQIGPRNKVMQCLRMVETKDDLLAAQSCLRVFRTEKEIGAPHLFLIQIAKVPTVNLFSIWMRTHAKVFSACSIP